MITNFLEWKNKHNKEGDGKMKGRIHSFDSFGTVDGPGIRFMIFMQGCGLKCKYCHNRDTWYNNGGKLYTPEEVINEAKKYKTYFDLSGGGITVSGGDPLFQFEFLLELFKLAKYEGIHTCLDTSGFIDVEKIKPLLEYTDLILLDLKHMDDKTHRWLTGVSNERILSLTKFLSEIDFPIWIRHVLIPSVSDSLKHLNMLGNFLNELNNVKEFEFLPYHTMGKYKWYELGLTYELEHIRNANQDDIDRAMEIINSLKK